MDATRFYSRLAALLPGNPPARTTPRCVAKMKKLGIEPGKPFNATQLDAAKHKSLEDGMPHRGSGGVGSASTGLGGADIRNGWRIDRAMGRWGNDYGRRAVAAWNGIGANAPEDAIFMSTYLDGGGKRLDGANRYVLHFPANAMPPTDAFWSLSLYSPEQKFVPNAKNRHHLGSNDKLKTNADGSLDIVIAAEAPGGDMEANWLPSPKGPFNLILRVYWPKEDVLVGRWNPPGVKLAATIIAGLPPARPVRHATSRSARHQGGPAHHVLSALHHRGHPARLHRHRHRHPDAAPGTGAGGDRRLRRIALPAVGVQVDDGTVRRRVLVRSLRPPAHVDLRHPARDDGHADARDADRLRRAARAVHRHHLPAQRVRRHAGRGHRRARGERAARARARRGQRLHVRRCVRGPDDRRRRRALPHRGDAVLVDVPLRRGRRSSP